MITRRPQISNVAVQNVSVSLHQISNIIMCARLLLRMASLRSTLSTIQMRIWLFVTRTQSAVFQHRRRTQISYTLPLRAMPSSMSTTILILLIKLIFLRRGLRDLDHALHAFLNLSDAEIRQLARNIKIWSLWLERGHEFLCAALLDYWS